MWQWVIVIIVAVVLYQELRNRRNMDQYRSQVEQLSEDAQTQSKHSIAALRDQVDYLKKRVDSLEQQVLNLSRGMAGPGDDD